MRNKTAVLLAFFFLISALFVGCSQQEQAPVVSYEGFEASAPLTGGEEVVDANVKGLAISESGSDLVITFGFLSGSRLSGGASESPAASAPSYTISMLKNPARLVVEFSNIAYWDYARNFTAPSAALLFGCFQTRFTGDSALRFTFQLTGDAVYKTEPLTGGLVIVVRPVVKAEATNDAQAQDITMGQRYFAVADAYRDYCDGILPRDAGATPVLAKNGSDIVMLSPAYYSEAEAKNFITSLAAKNEGIVEAQWDVSLLAQNEAPAFDEQQSYERAYTQDVVRIDGTPAAAEVFIKDGLYLCHTPDKKVALYSKRLTGGQPGVDEYTYEQIFHLEDGSQGKPYLDFEFQVVEQAKFSPDGRKLAVLERDGERTHLYVFDAASRELLTDLTDAGFGELVSAFTWDSLGLSIYAVSGSGAMQVHQYDFGVPQEAKRHSVVDKNGADEGYIAYSDGELYFTQSDLESGEMIYRIKPDGGVRKAFAPGGAFALSPDNRYMALSVSATGAETAGGIASFSLLDMDTGESAVITKEFSVNNFLWSFSGAKLYYIENRLAGEGGEGATSTEEEESQATATPVPADPYPYTLWVYDPATKQSIELMDLPYPWITVSGKTDEAYLNYYDADTGGELVRATYLLPMR